MASFTSFPDILRCARLERGWSQEQLARKIKTTRVTIYRWEQAISTPSPIFWSRLTAFLNCPVATFFAPVNTSDEIIGDITNPSEAHPKALASMSSQAIYLPLSEQIETPIQIAEAQQIVIEQQRLILAEQRLALNRDHLHYIHDLVENLLPLLYPTTNQSLRPRILELLFDQIEQNRQETHQEFPSLSFSQIKHLFDLAQQEEVCAIDPISSKADEGKLEAKAEKARQTFSLRLRQERTRRGWSQYDLARKVNCDTKTLSRWERGINLPSPYYRQKIYEIFQVSLEDLGLLLFD